MRKNYLFCIRLETEKLLLLKKQAETLGISLSELCRQKLNEYPQLTKIELMLEDIKKKLNTK